MKNSPCCDFTVNSIRGPFRNRGRSSRFNTCLSFTSRMLRNVVDVVIKCLRSLLRSGRSVGKFIKMTTLSNPGKMLLISTPLLQIMLHVTLICVNRVISARKRPILILPSTTSRPPTSVYAANIARPTQFVKYMLFFMTCRVLFTAVLYPATRLSNWSMAFQTPPRLRMIVLFRVTFCIWLTRADRSAFSTCCTLTVADRRQIANIASSIG
mmetsp:Transcript_61991/g.145386  ORF Transcript_61991/g.145386 Transcript_61991/m.145386 type:complete len:211 (+) Transcript_61991:881-1513(+)